MSAKKQNSLAEVVRDAATGYTTVVLGVICFLLALVVVTAGIRIFTGSNALTTTPATDPATAPTAESSSEGGQEAEPEGNPGEEPNDNATENGAV